jgi:hypothetical protein
MVLCLSELVPRIQQELAIFRSVEMNRPTFTAMPIPVSAWLKAKIMDMRLPKPSIRSDDVSRFAWVLNVCLKKY